MMLDMLCACVAKKDAKSLSSQAVDFVDGNHDGVKVFFIENFFLQKTHFKLLFKERMCSPWEIISSA